jgi:lipopolysaccharide/colanic/teichoic acid biosynthesis glycosyltransferase
VIAVDSGRPVFCGQRRVGLDRRLGARRDRRERTFTCWKFRTMVQHADRMRADLVSRNAAPFPAFKVRDDPRITKVGRFLRRSSLDEIPQLWNVLKGEMSLVGPRPALPTEVASYDALSLQRLAVRPGLTCFWQVENRQSTDATFAQWVERDLAYVSSWSIALDLRLMMRTLAAVVRMTGE